MISVPIHQGACDGWRGDRRCSAAGAFHPLVFGMTRAQLTAQFLVRHPKWTARDGKLYCPDCRAREAEVPVELSGS